MSRKPVLKVSKESFVMTDAEAIAIQALAKANQELNRQMESIASEARRRNGLDASVHLEIDLLGKLWKRKPVS